MKKSLMEWCLWKMTKIKEPDYIRKLFEVGMQFSKTENGKFAAFGFDQLERDRAIRVKKIYL